MNWYIGVLKKYAVFGGRAQRAEYWMFTLISIVISVALSYADGMVGTNGVLGAVYALATLVPGLAVTVRRLHDTGKSAWYLLVAIIPVVNLLMIYWLATDGTPGDNAYGPNPKAA